MLDEHEGVLRVVEGKKSLIRAVRSFTNCQCCVLHAMLPGNNDITSHPEAPNSSVLRNSPRTSSKASKSPLASLASLMRHWGIGEDVTGA
jgi:hypothetical protein